MPHSHNSLGQSAERYRKSTHTYTNRKLIPTLTRGQINEGGKWDREEKYDVALKEEKLDKMAGWKGRNKLVGKIQNYL